MKEVFPQADVQRCVIHKVLNALNLVRRRDQPSVAEDLKPIYQAHEQFALFKAAWEKKYPKVVHSWEQDLSVLLTFLDYPA